MRLIDADALKNEMLSHAPIIVGDFYKILDFIDKAPIVERPRGEWIKESLQIDEYHFRSFAKCKVCNCGFRPYSFAVKEFDFCPKCGADMRKSGE